MTNTTATQDNYSNDRCDACHDRAAGHGHFGLYCQPCSELPYWADAAK